MQPLDRGVFGPFKTYYNTTINEWMLKPEHFRKQAIIYVAKVIGKAFLLAFTPRNIMPDLQVSGIHPLNENIFQDYELLPFNVTDQLMPTPTCEDQPENKTILMQYNLNAPGPSIVTGITNHCFSSFANQININIMFPEDIRPYSKG